MADVDSPTAKPRVPFQPDFGVILRRFGLFVGVWLGIIASPVFRHLLFGWISFLFSGLAGSSFHGMTLLIALLSGCGWVIGLCWILKWTRDTSSNQTSDTPVASRCKQAVRLAILLLLMFSAGIAIVGIVHQVSWLATSSQPFYEKSSARFAGIPLLGSAESAALRNQSKWSIKTIELAIHNYLDVSPSNDESYPLPAGGIYDETGRGMHGWMTPILPYVGEGFLTSDVDFKQPWNSAANKPYFQSPIHYYWNPAINQRVDDEGYPLAHYSANVHVMFPNSRLLRKQITDGESQTILFGEVSGRFVPWGAPNNFRDPARGINRFPDGFGGASGTRGAHMAFVDGSIKQLNQNIDPSVLRALSTPSAGDDVGDFK